MTGTTTGHRQRETRTVYKRGQGNTAENDQGQDRQKDTVEARRVRKQEQELKVQKIQGQTRLSKQNKKH